MNSNDVSSLQKPRPSLGKSLLLAVGFGLLGYLGNLVRLPLGFNLSFIFGSIFTLACTVLLGWRWGLVSTLLASVYTFFLWNHPYAIVILGAETLWVACALRRGHRNLLQIVTLFWVLVGIPLVYLFYGSVQHLGLQVTTATALKQAVNGCTNALIASALLRYLPVETWLGLGDRPRLHPLGAVLYDLSLLLLLVPSVAMVILLSHREIALGERRVVEELSTEATYREGVLQNWADRQLLAIAQVAAAGQQLGMAPSPRLQARLQQIHAFVPDFINLSLCDADGRAVAFDPLLNDLGKSSIGLAFSDHSYYLPLKTTLKPVISEAFVGRRAAFRPLFVMSVPLVEEGRFRGFGSGAINLDDLRAALTRSQGEEPPLLTLLDTRDQVVVTTDPRLRPLNPLAEPPGTRVQKVTERVSLVIPPARKNISLMDAWKLARYTTRIPVRGTPWTLIVERSAGPLQTRAFQLITWTLFGLFGLFLAVLLVASLVARNLSRATVKLAHFSKNLPARIEADEALLWPETHFEEIALMTAHFRATAEALGERILQLKIETELRLTTERAMMHQARLAAMGEMLGHIAHQWRQPLNALSMLLANLRDAVRLGERDPEALEGSFTKGNSLIQKMSATINDFRNFFRPDKQMVPFSALHQARAALGLMESSLVAANVAVQIEAEGDLELLGFPNEYSQVLLNLLSNGLQAIQAAHAAGGHLRIRLWAADGLGCLTVTDDGTGLPADHLDRIFDPFFTTRETGTGLGLYMSRQIIEGNMGGQISARNLDQGAEFTVRVPLAEGEP